MTPATASSAPAIASRRVAVVARALAVIAVLGLTGCAGQGPGASPEPAGRAAIHPASARAIESAFLERAAAPDATFRIETVARVEVVGLTARSTIVVESHLGIRGGDAVGTVTVTGSDSSRTTADVVHLDDQAWARFEGGEWTGPTPLTASPVGAPNPFIGLDVGDARYAGRSTSLAPDLHRLDASDAPPPELGQVAGELAGATVTGYTRTILVRSDGTPFASHVVLTLYGEVGPAEARQPATVTVTATSRIRGWGEPVEVVAPGTAS